MHTRESVAEPARSQNIELELERDEMYPKEYTGGGAMKHSRLCQARSFRRDWNCHRCVEILLAAAPYDGWEHEYFAKKLGKLQRRLF